MKTNGLLSALCVVAVGLGMAAGDLRAANAAPLHISGIEAPASTVTQINHRGWHRSGVTIYFNGHRGYHHRRPGYRHHGGYWFPPAAFALGAILGGAIVGSPPYYDPYYPAPVYRGPVGSVHQRWCHSRYRSYRAWDNSWQPYRGGRRQCWSPYS